MARAIRGSNSIEGYDVTLDDALAAVEEDEPLNADRRTWAEITGYRAAMTYVQQLAEAEHFEYNTTLLSSLHYMMLSHDLSKLPGQFRRGPVFVHDEQTDEIVYEGPDWLFLRTRWPLSDAGGTGPRRGRRRRGWPGGDPGAAR